jgi:hypothetical protein
MLQKARPAPHMLPAIPIRAPGHMPKVNPMSVRDDANPKRGGCEDKTEAICHVTSVSMRTRHTDGGR